MRNLLEKRLKETTDTQPLAALVGGEDGGEITKPCREREEVAENQGNGLIELKISTGKS